VFLNQRQKGYDAGIKSDLRNAATAEETYLTDNGTYTTDVTQLQANGFKYSSSSDYTSGTTLIVPKLDGGVGSNKGYCISATSASGTVWSYNSELGGLQAKGVVCDASFT
jgi:type IV pilus assembly protein PilA